MTIIYNEEEVSNFYLNLFKKCYPQKVSSFRIRVTHHGGQLDVKTGNTQVYVDIFISGCIKEDEARLFINALVAFKYFPKTWEFVLCSFSCRDGCFSVHIQFQSPELQIKEI